MGCSTPESKFGFSFSTPYLFDRKRDVGGWGRAGGSGGAAPQNLNSYLPLNLVFHSALHTFFAWKKRCGGRGAATSTSLNLNSWSRGRGAAPQSFWGDRQTRYLFRGEVTDRPGIFSQWDSPWGDRQTGYLFSYLCDINRHTDGHDNALLII